jgi:hypothetical protein
MRLVNIVLLVCLMPASAAFSADDTGDRGYPAGDTPACLDRSTNSALGGCVTNQAGVPLDLAPRALPPEQNTDRQSPPGSTAGVPVQLPGEGSEDRSSPADNGSR